MTHRRTIRRAHRALLPVMGLCFAGLAGCSEPPAAAAQASAAANATAAPDTAAWQQVVPFDQGLGMPTGSMQIPAGWKHAADIVTDPVTGLPQRFRMELRGPDGETLIALGAELYMGMTGGSLAQTADAQLRRGLGDEFAGLKLGELQASENLAQSTGFRRASEKARSMGYRAEALEASAQATRNGAPLAGRLYVTHFRQDTPQGIMGMASVGVVMAPPERLAQALDVNLRVAESARPNPEYERRVEAIGTAYRQQQNAQFQANLRQQNERFQANLRQRQAAFEASQQAVRERSAMQDRSHQRYMDTLRGNGGGAAGGSGYTQHDQVIDNIYERSSFDDPYSGQRTTRDGYYDNWYQDNRGNYYGTDDPNYKPPQDWERIEPLKPGQ